MLGSKLEGLQGHRNVDLQGLPEAESSVVQLNVVFDFLSVLLLLRIHHAREAAHEVINAELAKRDTAPPKNTSSSRKRRPSRPGLLVSLV